MLFVRMLIGTVTIMSVVGCSPTVHTAGLTAPAPMAATPQPPSNPTPAPAVAPAAIPVDSSDDEEARLAQFWHERSHGSALADYPLGAGDVLVISVPGMEEIHNREVRISGTGTIALPLIGTVSAHGLTEEELREELRQRLESDYMYNPQVDIFVREYRSRQVAVLGAVAQPGLYSLASENDTLLDMLSMAGGLTETATTRIHFIPAEPIKPGQRQSTPPANQLASAMPTQLSAQDTLPALLKRADPLVIDIQKFAKGNSQLSLTIPARPGDVILVPAGGEVLVDGWVKHPGSYKITPGLTVLGAVAAAGGPSFAADSSQIQVLRAGRSGEKTLLVVDLDNIKRGLQRDIAVEEGDVIDVASSTARLVPYGMYQFFTSVFRVGGSVPITGF